VPVLGKDDFSLRFGLPLLVNDLLGKIHYVDGCVDDVQPRVQCRNTIARTTRGSGRQQPQRNEERSPRQGEATLMCKVHGTLGQFSTRPFGSALDA
jgi:hypothetical protein